MAKPTIEENILIAGGFTATIWQDVEDGVPEQAIVVQTYENGAMIRMKTDRGEVLINSTTVDELCKLLRRWSKTK